MSLSPAQIAISLPRIRELLESWKDSQANEIGVNSKIDSKNCPQKDVLVAFRTRPILDWENGMLLEMTNGSVNTIESSSESEDSSQLCYGISMTKEMPGVTVIHTPTMKWNGPTLTHKSFDSDVAFPPTSSDDDVYRLTVASQDMMPLVVSGGVGCILAYGQTGTGKTHTMTALESRIATDLFACIETLGSELRSQKNQSNGIGEPRQEGENDIFDVTVTFLEVVGKSVYDLAAMDGTNENRTAVNIAEDKLGKVGPDAARIVVKSGSDLKAHIEKCLSYRRTTCTTRNKASSRSHAILNISIRNRLLPQLTEGELILVDLAGSERYEDSKAHSKQLMEESRENNKSLLALKECVRARARAGTEDGFAHIPYRSSRLTWLLKPIFDLEETRPIKTVVIAHVSPHIQDSSHSMNTLMYAAPFRILPPRRAPPPFDTEDPRTWDHAYTISWLRETFMEQFQVRRKIEWDKQDAAARPFNKRLSPLPIADQSKPCLIDLELFCPIPHGGIYLASIYGAEWVKRCLACRRKDLPLNDDQVVAVIQNDGLSVYLAFSQLLVHARTKTRNAAMNSRPGVYHGNETNLPKENSAILALEEEERFDFLSIYDEDTRIKIQEEWIEKGLATRLTAHAKVFKACLNEFREKRKLELQYAEELEAKYMGMEN